MVIIIVLAQDKNVCCTFKEDILKEKFITILQQSNSECYCEFNAKVDLAVVKRHTCTVPAMEDKPPIPKTLTSY